MAESKSLGPAMYRSMYDHDVWSSLLSCFSSLSRPLGPHMRTAACEGWEKLAGNFRSATIGLLHWERKPCNNADAVHLCEMKIWVKSFWWNHFTLSLTVIRARDENRKHCKQMRISRPNRHAKQAGQTSSQSHNFCRSSGGQAPRTSQNSRRTNAKATVPTFQLPSDAYHESLWRPVSSPADATRSLAVEGF